MDKQATLPPQALIPVNIQDFIGLLIEQYRPLVREELKKLLSEQADEKLLTPTETCKLLKVSKNTLRNWTDQDLLQKQTIGAKCYYRQREVLEAMKSLKKYKAGK